MRLSSAHYTSAEASPTFVVFAPAQVRLGIDPGVVMLDKEPVHRRHLHLRAVPVQQT